MKRMIILTAVFVMSALCIGTATASDEDDVRAAENARLGALNAGDGNAFVQYYLPESTTFAGGNLLTEGMDAATVSAQINAGYKSGVRFNLQWRHMDVSVFGNTAIITGYRAGTNTQPDGTVNQANGQVTIVWVKQSGQWKVAHSHFAPLSPPTGQ